jgi:hypothetical protein
VINIALKEMRAHIFHHEPVQGRRNLCHIFLAQYLFPIIALFFCLFLGTTIKWYKISIFFLPWLPLYRIFISHSSSSSTALERGERQTVKFHYL